MVAKEVVFSQSARRRIARGHVAVAQPEPGALPPWMAVAHGTERAAW